MFFELDHEQIIAFVQAYRHLAPLVIFFIAMGETIIVLSLFIPSTLLLFALSGLLAASGVPLLPSLLAGALGASIGFGLSYLMGAMMNQRILRLWPLRNHPETVEKARQFIQKWGIWAVMFGHFAGPVRPVIPILGGMAHMPPAPFLAANMAGSLAWVTVFFAPGYLLVTSPHFESTLERLKALLP
jgi:membrane protein DedA with SNARE-associated domain